MSARTLFIITLLVCFTLSAARLSLHDSPLFKATHQTLRVEGAETAGKRDDTCKVYSCVQPGGSCTTSATLDKLYVLLHLLPPSLLVSTFHKSCLPIASALLTDLYIFSCTHNSTCIADTCVADPKKGTVDSSCSSDDDCVSFFFSSCALSYSWSSSLIVV